MLPYIEYSNYICSYVYLTSVILVALLALLRMTCIKRIKQTNISIIVSKVISILDIIIISFSSYLLFLYNSKTSIISLVLFVVIMFTSEILCKLKWVGYSTLCFILSFGSIIVNLVTHGVHTGIYSISSHLGIPLTLIIMLGIYVALCFLYSRYNEYYYTRVLVSVLFSILLCGIFNSFVLNFIYLICFVIIYLFALLFKTDSSYVPYRLKDVSQNIKKLIIANWLTIFPPIFMIIVSYFFLGPMEIYAGNKTEFSFSYTDFFFFFLVLGLIISIVLTLLISIIPNSIIFKFVTAAIFSFSISSYVQNMFLNIKLHQEDGGYLNYDALKNFIIFDTIVWIILFITIISIIFIFKKNWRNIVIYSASFFSLIQLVALISLLATSKPGVGNNNFIFTGENELGIAKEKNIIIIVLDSFGNKCLDKALVKYPDMLNGLNDFTYYSNANADYQRTFPSMSHMLTGFEMKEGLSDVDYLNEAWTSPNCQSFYHDVHSSGYDFRIYTGDRAAYYGNGTNLLGKIDNVEISGSNINKPELFILLLKTSAFKYMPYICKHTFETITWEFDKATSSSHVAETDTDVYYQKLLNEGLFIDKNVQNAITVKHLFGLHDTDKVNANVEKDVNATLEDCAKGVMVVIDEYLNQLKALGKYDDSTIIITADHGQGLFDYDNPEYSKDNLDVQVIYFIKESNERNDKMKISNAPIRHCDLMPSIIYYIEKNGNHEKSSDSMEKHRKYGTAFIEHKNNEKRPRFFFYKTDSEYQLYNYIGNRDDLEYQMEISNYKSYTR